MIADGVGRILLLQPLVVAVHTPGMLHFHVHMSSTVRLGSFLIAKKKLMKRGYEARKEVGWEDIRENWRQVDGYNHYALYYCMEYSKNKEYY